MSYSRPSVSGMSNNESIGTIGSGRPLTRKGITSHKRLHISNIPFSMDEAELAGIFRPFGPILEAQIISNKRGSKGFGFVTFENYEDAIRAKQMNGFIINDRMIEVNDALPKNKYTIVPRPGATNDPALREVLAQLNQRHTISFVPKKQPIRQARNVQQSLASMIKAGPQQSKFDVITCQGSVSSRSSDNNSQELNELDLSSALSSGLSSLQLGSLWGN